LLKNDPTSRRIIISLWNPIGNKRAALPSCLCFYQFYVNTQLMPSTPKISVIIPTYNQEKFIGRCLRSLLDQSHERFNYEIIVIDDASQDKTLYALNLFKEDFPKNVINN